jgi:hypothetical protein
VQPSSNSAFVSRWTFGQWRWFAPTVRPWWSSLRHSSPLPDWKPLELPSNFSRLNETPEYGICFIGGALIAL